MTNLLGGLGLAAVAVSTFPQFTFGRSESAQDQGIAESDAEFLIPIEVAWAVSLMGAFAAAVAGAAEDRSDYRAYGGVQLRW